MRRGEHIDGPASSTYSSTCLAPSSAAMLTRAVVRTRAVRPDRRRRAIFCRPGGVFTWAATRAGTVRPDYDFIADATVTSAAVRRSREPPLFHT